MAEPETLSLMVTGMLGLGILAGLWAAGYLRADAMATAPRRDGQLTFVDAGITLGLWILLPVVAITTAQHGGWLGDSHEPEGHLQWMLLAQAAMLPVIGAAFWMTARCCDQGVWVLGIGMRNLPQAMIWALGGGVAMFFVTQGVSAGVVLLMRFAGHAPDAIAHTTLDMILAAPPGWVRHGLLLSAIVGAPVLEEMVFRGVLQTAMMQATRFKSRWTMIAMVSLIFAGIHWSAAEPHALPALFVLSLGLGVVYERTGSLWAPIGVHALFNAVNVAIVMMGGVG